MTADTQAPQQKAQPWSVKGVSAAARRAANDAAANAGLNLGQWLNQVIAQAHEPPAPRYPTAATITASAPDPHPAGLSVLPQVAEAITALEARIAGAQQTISAHYAPLRSSVEVLGVRVSALERVGDLTGADTSATTRAALARRLSGQGPIRPSAGVATAAADEPVESNYPQLASSQNKNRVFRRIAAAASVVVVGTSAAYIAIWFSLLSGPATPRQISAALPIEFVSPAANTANQDAAGGTAPTADQVLQLRLAAEAGSPEAQLQLANLYLTGTGVAQDYPAAAQWLIESAEGGNAAAQYSFGVLNERGLGVPQNANAAAVWFERAARQQHPSAQYALGIAFLEGRGRPQDYQKAAVWLERAARQDHGDAQYAYAVMLEDGLIGSSDNARAYEWYQAAIANGSSQAAERAALLVPRLVTTSSEPNLPSIPTAGSADASDRVLILRIEQLLRTLDFGVGTPDGILAGATVAAIEEYQAALALPVNGRPSQQLLEHLQSVTAR